MRKKVLLVCLCFAGGSSFSYRSWKKNIDKEYIQVVPIEYSGHGLRWKDKLLNTMEECCDDIISRVREYELEKYELMFYGHSMGGVIAFNCCHRLHEEYNVNVIGIFLGAAETPMDMSSFTGYEYSTDFIKKNLIMSGRASVEMIESNQFRDNIFPQIINDYQLMNNFVYKENGLLDCPMWGFVGKEDEGVTFEDLQHWNDYIEGDIEIHTVKGAHYFLEQGEDVCSLINEIVKKEL